MPAADAAGIYSSLTSKRPRHHERELCAPQLGSVRHVPLAHHDVRTRIAQRACPACRVLEEERLERAAEEVDAGKRGRQLGRRFVTTAWRAREDRAVDVRMAKP